MSKWDYSSYAVSFKHFNNPAPSHAVKLLFLLKISFKLEKQLGPDLAILYEITPIRTTPCVHVYCIALNFLNKQELLTKMWLEKGSSHSCSTSWCKEQLIRIYRSAMTSMKETRFRLFFVWAFDCIIFKYLSHLYIPGTIKGCITCCTFLFE